MQLSFFNDQVDKYFSALSVGRIYAVSDAQVKPAGKFNSTNCEIEMHVNTRTEILELPEENSIPQKALDFTKIRDILNVEQN